MFQRFYPYAYGESVFAIDYEKLYDKGYRGIIFDIDNTLVHHGDDSTKEIDDLFRRIQGIGFKTLLLTNNEEKRVHRFLTNIDSFYICDAGKPDPAGYLKAVAFTDILGANRCGMASILVKFIRLKSETRIGKRRQLERLILMFYRRNKKYRNRLGDVFKKEGDENAVE